MFLHIIENTQNKENLIFKNLTLLANKQIWVFMCKFCTGDRMWTATMLTGRISIFNVNVQ